MQLFLIFDELNEDVRNQVKGVLLLSLSALTLTGLLFTEKTGEFGLFLNNLLRFTAGEVAIILPVIIGTIAFKVMLPKQIRHLRSRLFGILLFLFILMIAAHLNLMIQVYNSPELVEGTIYEASLRLGTEHKGGGILGALLSIALYFFFKDIGSYIVLVALSLIAFLLITNLSITEMIKNSIKLIFVLFNTIKSFLASVLSSYKYIFSYSDKQEKFGDKAQQELAVAEEEILEEDDYVPNKNKIDTITDKKIETIYENKKLSNKLNNNKAGTFPQKNENTNLEQISNNIEDNYFLPPLTLLPKIRGIQDTKQQKVIKERGKIIETTLSSFGVNAKICGIHVGPTVARYELQPEVGVKVSKIVNLSNDLALSLAASGVRIEAPIPGKAAIGIEVPNKVISLVYLREVLESKEFQANYSPLAVSLGKDITGKPVIADLQKMPHLLVAGATGSGKSVCINTIIASILFKASPKTVKFLMIDPKVVELNIYNGIPHLITPVINEPKKAAIALRNILREMNRRYQLFANESVRDIVKYNQLAIENTAKEYLPYYVVIIDELADLMMVAPSDVEDAIARLSQMARAAGIHLVIATQRPSVDVITGVIKANITSRIAFAVSSNTDSRTILDEGGAEKLLGRGDMLFHPVGAPKPYRVQGAYIAETELQNLVSYVTDQGQVDYNDDITTNDAHLEQNKEEDEDELFREAVFLIAESGQASISILQRRLRIGYTRAARIIDTMEARGIIGKFEGSKPREVLITPEQLSEYNKD